MTIYVEYAIIDNLVINSFLLLLVNKFMKFNAPKWKIFISSTIGTIFSLITPILPNWCNIVIKILLLILMPLIICKNANFKKLTLSSLLFLFLTFVFIGLIMVFCYTFNIDFSYGENGETFYNFPVGLALLLSSFLFIVLKHLINYFYQKKHLVILAHFYINSYNDIIIRKVGVNIAYNKCRYITSFRKKLKAS